MFTLDTTQILVASIIAASISILIFSAGYAIGKYVQASMVREELENIYAQVSTIRRGLKTLKKVLESLRTAVR